MAGRGTISVNQSKQYGDQKALDAMKATTTTPMTGVPTPAPSAGRPPGPSQGQPQGGPSAQADIDPGHMTKMEELALALRVKQYWDSVAAQYPSSWSKMYAADADENYQRIAHEMRSVTPFFS
jgi:hypothetical protein